LNIFTVIAVIFKVIFEFDKVMIVFYRYSGRKYFRQIRMAIFLSRLYITLNITCQSEITNISFMQVSFLILISIFPSRSSLLSEAQETYGYDYDESNDKVHG